MDYETIRNTILEIYEKKDKSYSIPGMRDKVQEKLGDDVKAREISKAINQMQREGLLTSFNSGSSIYFKLAKPIKEIKKGLENLVE